MDGRNEPVLLREDEGGVVRLTLNRPQARNALSRGLMTALEEELARIARRPLRPGRRPRRHRPRLLRRARPARDARASRGRAAYERLFAQCCALMQAHHPPAAAGDRAGPRGRDRRRLPARRHLRPRGRRRRRPASRRPGVNIGLFCSTPMVALSRNVGRKQAMEMLLTGEMVDAERRPARSASSTAWCRPTSWTRRSTSWPRPIADKSPLTLQDRQGGVLPPARDRRSPTPTTTPPRHGREHAGPRRGGGHRRVPREARARLDRDLSGCRTLHPPPPTSTGSTTPRPSRRAGSSSPAPAGSSSAWHGSTSCRPRGCPRSRSPAAPTSASRA